MIVLILGAEKAAEQLALAINNQTDYLQVKLAGFAHVSSPDLAFNRLQTELYNTRSKSRHQLTLVYGLNNIHAVMWLIDKKCVHVVNMLEHLGPVHKEYRIRAIDLGGTLARKNPKITHLLEPREIVSEVYHRAGFTRAQV